MEILFKAGAKKQLPVYEMDLTRITGNGDFPCPNCGITISPEDDSESAYSILDTKFKDQVLNEVVVKCNKCESQIRLTGFQVLEMNDQ